jgi:hypothetical protein
MSDDDGLAFAISYALAVYAPDDDTERNASGEVPRGRPISKSRFARAIGHAATFGPDIAQFAATLQRNVTDVEKIADEDLSRHVIAALENYVARQGSGVDPDPW